MANDNLSDRDSARLFVGGLPYECSDEELRALVNQIQFQAPPKDCELLECRVLKERGCGYLRFSSWEAAKEAIEALNERQVSGWAQPLRAKWSTPKGSSEGGSDGWDRRSGGGNGRTMDKDWDQGRDRTARGGNSGGGRGDHDTPRDKESRGTHRGGGSARSSGGGDDHDSCRDNEDDVDRHRLFVGQLRKKVSQEEIEELFREFGRIESCHVLEDKGVAYVTFDRESEARRAIKALDGVSNHMSRGEGLNVQFAKKR